MTSHDDGQEGLFPDEVGPPAGSDQYRVNQMSGSQPRDKAFARRSDPSTSHAAADSVESTIRQSQEQVLKLFRQYKALTDTALCNLAESHGIKQSRSGLRTRRRELVDAGLLYDTGKKIRLPSGRLAIVWRLNE